MTTRKKNSAQKSAQSYHPDTCAYCGADALCSYIRNRPQCLPCKVERFIERVLLVRLTPAQREWVRGL